MFSNSDDDGRSRTITWKMNKSYNQSACGEVYNKTGIQGRTSAQCKEIRTKLESDNKNIHTEKSTTRDCRSCWQWRVEWLRHWVWEVALHPRQCIGSCESYYDLPQNSFDTKTTELRTIHKVSAELTKTLQDTVNKASPEMTESERERWKNLVWWFHGIFATSKADLGKTSLVRHKINTGNAVPIRIPARRLPLGKRKTEQEEVKSMIERGVIQPSTSPWASPIVLVTKKDGTIRFCVDYRALNNVSIKDAYPLLRIDDSLDALNGGRYFNTMDLMSGFWQIEMAPEDQEKTAFSTSLGLYEFKVMPFVLVNAPASFERLMETVLHGL